MPGKRLSIERTGRVMDIASRWLGPRHWQALQTKLEHLRLCLAALRKRAPPVARASETTAENLEDICEAKQRRHHHKESNAENTLPKAYRCTSKVAAVLYEQRMLRNYDCRNRYQPLQFADCSAGFPL